jgi:hypothetical protein
MERVGVDGVEPRAVVHQALQRRHGAGQRRLVAIGGRRRVATRERHVAEHHEWGIGPRQVVADSGERECELARRGSSCTDWSRLTTSGHVKNLVAFCGLRMTATRSVFVPTVTGLLFAAPTAAMSAPVP